MQLAVLSSGAPGTSARTTFEHKARVWHKYFFQFEGAAEAWLRYDDWQFFRDWIRGNGDVERYIDDLSRPGALTAALNWYRANAKPQPPGENDIEFSPVTCPVLGVWSDGDHYLSEAQMKQSTEQVDGPWRYEKITDASHWVALEKPTEINELLLDFME
jgi:pimeloyl-ACP methyl ester carboxylesterase